MTQEEILERNNEIARMINIEITQPYPENKDYKQSGIMYKLEKDFAIKVFSIYLHVCKLRFDTDWNWLHEAVEFIEKLSTTCSENRVVIHSTHVLIRYNDWFTIIQKESKKEAVFIAVSDFAKRYNEKKL